MLLYRRTPDAFMRRVSDAYVRSSHAY
jgi:hypothetical protein